MRQSDRNIMRKNKVTNYFMPAAIENNATETRKSSKISLKKKLKIWSYKFINPFILKQIFVFLWQNLEKDDAHVKHKGSNSSRGCIMMKVRAS